MGDNPKEKRDYKREYETVAEATLSDEGPQRARQSASRHGQGVRQGSTCREGHRPRRAAARSRHQQRALQLAGVVG